MRRPAAVMLLSLVVPASALAAPARERRERPFTVEDGRRLYNATALPGEVAGVSVSPAEGVAAYTQKVTLTLADPVSGPVDVALPARFSERAQNGRAYVPGTPSGSRELSAASRSVSFDVGGLPAGTYALPIRRGGRKAGAVRFRLYAPRKEGVESEDETPSIFGPVQRVPLNASAGQGEESETFVVLDPNDAKRVVAYGNDIGGSGDGGVHVTSDGGATWAHPQFPESYTTPTGVDHELPGGDPILAADTLGNIWAGGLSLCGSATEQGRLFVNRIAPGTSSFQPHNAGLPYLHTGNSCDLSSVPADYGVIQDKPQMTIDNAPSSPTYGRLYVTWDDPRPSGDVNVAITFCDTRPGGTPDAAHCDTGANWSTPAVISDASGSYISSDVAVGPDGKVYVVWWDFSSANQISADMCDAAAHSCDNSAGWGTDATLASLSKHPVTNLPVPFQCNTLAQPGGRAAPMPSIAVDHSGGANRGRIYVAWSDLDTSGTTRCSDAAWFTPGTSAQDTFDSFVASAPDFATLTTGAPGSGTRGTSIITDAGDHWFPWIAVDQSTGNAYVDLYSTRDDSSRKTTQFYKRAVVPGSGTQVTFDALTRVSTDSSTFADRPCCQFGNDYGDYTGLDAAQGVVAAVWTHRHTTSEAANVEVDLPPLPTPPTTTDTTPTTTTTTTSTTPTTTVPTSPPPVDRTPPFLKLTLGTRADRKGRYAVKLAATGEAAAGSATLRLATGTRRKLASGLLASSGSKPLKLVLRLKKKDLALLKRKHKLRVTLTVSLTDIAGNTARGKRAFTLRLKR
jgi:hypothetical protein